MEVKWKQETRSDILTRLNGMRKDEELCDAILESSDGVLFTVHRNILAASSPYFRAMFCGGFKEAQKDKNTPVGLPEVSSKCLEIVLNSIYTKTLGITDDDVYDVIAVAHMWCLEDIVELCAEHMTKNLSKETCFKSSRTAEHFALSSLMEESNNFVLKNLVIFSECSDFLEMRVEILCRYLRDDNLVGQEIEILRAAKSWLEFDADRLKHVPEIMSLIRFHSMTTDQLVDEGTNGDVMRKNSESLGMVLQALKYQANVYSQPLVEAANPRGIEKVIVIEEGESGKRGYSMIAPGSMYMYRKADFKSDHTFALPCDMIQLEVIFIESSMNLVTIGNFLFLFGVDNSYSNVAFRFDGSRQTWLVLAPIPKAATVASAIGRAGHRHIVSVGGMLVTKESRKVRNGWQLDNSVFRYSVRRNCWKKRTPFPKRIAFAVQCTFQGTLYVAGGVVPRVSMPLFNIRTASSSVFTWSRMYAYDNSTKAWLRKASMRDARSEAVLEAVDSKLFLLGGCRDEDDEPVPSIEVYDIGTDQWSFVEKEPGFPYDAAASFVDGKEIILLGGFNYQRDFASDNITVFSTCSKEQNEWLSVMKPKLRNITCQHVCAVLKMPP